MKEIQQIYGSRIKFIFRHFPLSMHDKAYEAAVATEAAGEQGKFWAMVDQLFTNQQEWANSPNYRQLWTGYAQKIGLDIDKFQTAMAGIATKNRVDQDAARGRGMGVSSTPSVYINGRLIPYPEVKVASLRQIIDNELQQAAATQSAPAGSNSAANN
jgi:protein-disulfide isomerase